VRKAVAALLAAVLAPIACACSREAKSPSCLVSTDEGRVQGLDQGSSCAYLGIPFAAPPVGPLRWQRPQPMRSWSPATLQATVEPPVCAQVSPEGSGILRGTEDCLTLNIWTANTPRASAAPVIVWIHDGGFTAHSGQIADRDVRHLIARTGAVIVSVNYRLGPFGFLALGALTHENPGYPSAGNYGLLDQRAALVWIRDHIAAFGGDPGDVTIAGQSAGAHSASLHVVSPLSKGLFTRAIMQNGWASTRWRTRAEAEALGEDFAAALRCTEPAKMLTCLRSQSPEQILLALPTGLEQFAETARAPWGPNVDGLEVPDQPRALYETGRFNRVPLVLGTVRDEGWVLVDRSFPSDLTEPVYDAEIEAEFGTADAPRIRARYPLAEFRSPKHALARITGDVESVCEARRIAVLAARAGTQVVAYSVDRATKTIDRNPEEGVRPLFDFMGDAWHQLEAGDYRAIASRREWSPAAAPCDLWDPLFLASVAGSVPASMR